MVEKENPFSFENGFHMNHQILDTIWSKTLLGDK